MPVISPPKLNWMDVLNEQFEWNTQEDLKNWFAKLTGKHDLSKASINEFQKCVNFIREQVSALHFGEDVDLKALDKKLSGIKLTVGKTNVLPPLHAKAQGTADTDLLKAMEETILVQFASFLSDFLSDETEVSLNRCEGLYKEQRSFDSESLAPSIDLEKRWRKEIPILSECKLLSSPDIHRCGDFFIGKAKARFCSEACRFRTFQLNKQLTDPDYLADKQRRYRERQQ